jgi:hypothetical protein
MPNVELLIDTFVGDAFKIIIGTEMKANPRDWRIESFKSVAEANNVAFRQPGGSHVIFRHTNGAMLSDDSSRDLHRQND